MDVDMRGFPRIALVGVEEEAQAGVAEEGWHGGAHQRVIRRKNMEPLIGFIWVV